MSKNCPFCDSNELLVVQGTLDREGLPVNIACGECGAQGPWTYVSPKMLGNVCDPETVEYVAHITKWDNRVVC